MQRVALGWGYAASYVHPWGCRGVVYIRQRGRARSWPGSFAFLHVYAAPLGVVVGHAACRRSEELSAALGGESMQNPASELPRILLPETVWKLLRTGQPPYHEPRHRRVDEGLTCGAQPLVILGHPPVVAYPCEGTLYHPPPWQHLEAFGRHEPLPVHHYALLGPLRGPQLGHLLGDRFLGLAHHLHAQVQSLLCPTPAPSLVAGVHPQVRKAREASAHRLQQQPDAVLVGHPGALWTRAWSTRPSVSTSRWRFLPSTPLAGSKPRSLPPTPVVLTDWESTMAALGLGSLPSRARNSSRSSAFRRSQVPSMRHLLNQS